MNVEATARFSGGWLAAAMLVALAGLGCGSTVAEDDGGSGGGGRGGGGTGGVGTGPDCPERYPTDLSRCTGFETTCIYGGCSGEGERRIISCSDEGWVDGGCAVVAACPESPPTPADPCAPPPDGLPCLYDESPPCPSGERASFACEGGVWRDGCPEN